MRIQKTKKPQKMKKIQKTQKKTRTQGGQPGRKKPKLNACKRSHKDAHSRVHMAHDRVKDPYVG